MNLTRNQKEWIVISVVIGVILLALVLWFKSIWKTNGETPENCIENGYIIPPLDVLWGFSKELLPANMPEAVNGWMEFDEDVILHVEFADQSAYHFVLHGMCTTEDELLYPLLEVVQIQ